MPVNTPSIKINAVRQWGKEYVQTTLVGENFDDSNREARKFSQENGAVLVHAFNDEKVIEGQGTIAVEIFEQFRDQGDIDYVFLPIGGGGLCAGVGSYVRQMSPNTLVIGYEPLGSPSMKISIEKNEVIELDKINTFVDGGFDQKARGEDLADY